MTKTSKKMIWLLFLSFVIILIRDFTVYPAYSWGAAMLTSFIRLAVLFFTVLVTRFFRPGIWKQRSSAVILSFLWICLIPHSFYNITQIRHVSEICRIPQGGFFVGHCNSLLWSLLPLLIYGVGSLIVFLYSVDRLASLMRNSYKKPFLLGVFAYAAVATVIGIYSRIDSLISLFFDVHAKVILLGSIMKAPDFWINVLAYFAFANLAYFAGKAVFSKK